VVLIPLTLHLVGKLVLMALWTVLEISSVFGWNVIRQYQLNHRLIHQQNLGLVVLTQVMRHLLRTCAQME
jgi:hypothetical protein